MIYVGCHVRPCTMSDADEAIDGGISAALASCLGILNQGCSARQPPIGRYHECHKALELHDANAGAEKHSAQTLAYIRGF